MFHRPKSATEPSNASVTETQKTPAASDDVQSDVKSVMKSPASFLQTQQVLNTTQDQSDSASQPKEEEKKTMDLKEDKVEGAGEAATPAVARNAAYNAGSASYNAGSTFGTSVSSTTNYDRDTGRKLVVGQGINMSGEIDSCDHLIVEGTVEAALKGAAILDIYEQGTFYGTVEIQEATISGKFEGDLVVHGRLTLRSSAVVSGTISYGELSVEAGAELHGSISPASAMGQEAKTAPKKAAAKKLKAANNTAKEEDTQLPFASDAATA
ncbi:MAG: polymer-forming cytoskeletal protein [Alphaproteobacteria bacterium]|nr:polymer-forming cytoskeletal protein [Alphaproteobacteria bacterium]